MEGLFYIIIIFISVYVYYQLNHENPLGEKLSDEQDTDPLKDLEKWEINSQSLEKDDIEIKNILKFIYDKDSVPFETKLIDYKYVEIMKKMYQSGISKGKNHFDNVQEIEMFFMYHGYEDIDDVYFESLMMSMRELPVRDMKNWDWEEIYDEKIKSESKFKRRTISQDVKDKVWNRDGGKCVQCESNEKLEFDHIIPLSKGGSNTYRNIQLLCEPCNRSKSDKIG